jgi:hypothetical protein
MRWVTAVTSEQISIKSSTGVSTLNWLVEVILILDRTCACSGAGWTYSILDKHQAICVFSKTSREVLEPTQPPILPGQSDLVAKLDTNPHLVPFSPTVCGLI